MEWLEDICLSRNCSKARPHVSDEVRSFYFVTLITFQFLQDQQYREGNGSSKKYGL